MPTAQRKHLATLALLTTYFIWGVSIPIIKITLTEIPPLALAYLRFSIAGLLITPLFLFDNFHNPINPKDLPRLIIIALLGPAVTNVLFYFGVQKTTAINAGVIQALFPIGMLLVGVMFLNEKIRKLAIIGTIISTIGTILIIGQPLFKASLSVALKSFGGDFLILISVVTWIAYTIGSKELFEKYSFLTITAFSFLVAMIALFPFAALEYINNPTWTDHVTMVGVLGLSIIIIFASLFAYFFYEWSLKFVSAHRVGFVSHSQPLFTLAAAYFLLSERIDFFVASGAFLIIIGIFTATHHAPHHNVHHGHKL